MERHGGEDIEADDDELKGVAYFGFSLILFLAVILGLICYIILS